MVILYCNILPHEGNCLACHKYVSYSHFNVFSPPKAIQMTEFCHIKEEVDAKRKRGAGGEKNVGLIQAYSPPQTEINLLAQRHLSEQN